MIGLKTFMAAGLAAASIGVGGLVAAPTASAMPKTCAQAIQLAHTYIALGDVLYAVGNYTGASACYGRAEGVIEAAC